MSASNIAAEDVERVYEDYLEALLGGDRRRCETIAGGLRHGGVGVADLYVNLFQRSLYDVGVRWEQNRISVAVEHLATAITERLLTLFHSEVFSGPIPNRVAMIACVDGELHHLGGRMVADLFEMYSWRADFIGASTPCDDLVSLVDDRKPDILGLSVSISANLPRMLRTLEALSAAYPGLRILVGGQAFRASGLDAVKAFPNTTYFDSIKELERVLSADGL